MKFKSIFAAILFTVMCQTNFALAIDDFAGIPKLMVRGEARLRKPADEMMIQIGVVTQETLATKALQENNKSMQRIIANLVKVGLADTEYSTGRFSIRPVYSVPPQNPPPNWKATIEGYEVNNSLTIRTSKLDLAGPIIDAAGQAGANAVDNIEFRLKDPNVHQEEAITTATQIALEEANIVAQAANVKIVRILSIGLNEAQQPDPIKPFPMMMRTAAYESANTPIKAGDVDVTASVNILFELQ